MASGDKDESEENKEIINETREIFECFIETQLERDRERNALDPGTPGLPPEELPHTPDDRDNISWQIGKKLAGIADKLVVDDDSRRLISTVVQLVNVGPDNSRAFEEFTEIARKVISDGITWEKVATLFYFGYCIARDRLRDGFQHFLSQLLQWMVDVFSIFGIFRWMIKHGGWLSFLGDSQEESNGYTGLVYRSALIAAVAMIIVMAYRHFIR